MCCLYKARRVIILLGLLLQLTLNFITYIQSLCTYFFHSWGFIFGDFFLYTTNKSIAKFVRKQILFGSFVFSALFLHWLVMLLCSWCHKSPLRQNTICLKMEHKSQMLFQPPKMRIGDIWYDANKPTYICFHIQLSKLNRLRITLDENFFFVILVFRTYFSIY